VADEPRNEPNDVVTAAADTTAASHDDVFSADLAARLREHNALPYLFVGSGVSRRYLNLPDWEGMLRHFAEEIGEDLDFMLASVDGDLPAAASELARAFHPVWWQHRRYAAQRKLHKSRVRDTEAALKVAISAYFEERSHLQAGVPGVDDATLAAELDLLRRCVVDGVITTNFDDLTDELFPDYISYVGQDELILSDAQFVAETYKIHGSSRQPLSLVLTDRDYRNFKARNSYLAAKLLTIFAEHPVIFVGYSLTDQYIRDIIANIAAAVGPDRLEALQRQIYFVDWNADPATETTISPYYIEVLPGQNLPAQRIETHSFAPLFSALAQLDRPFPVRVLRELSKHVYDLVAHPDPEQARETVRALPFDAEAPDNLRVVFGVGSFTDEDVEQLADLGGKALERDDLAADVLGIRARPLSATNVLRVVLPQILRYSGNAHLPVYKYLHEAGLMEAGKPKLAGLSEPVKALVRRTPSPNANQTRRYENQIKGVLTTPAAVFASDYPLYFKLDCLLRLDASGFDLDELRDVLVRTYAQLDDLSISERTSLYKGISRYDRLLHS
jgi:hypothetical protein